jgi:hypothetical protein
MSVITALLPLMRFALSLITTLLPLRRPALSLRSCRLTFSCA